MCRKSSQSCCYNHHQLLRRSQPHGPTCRCFTTGGLKHTLKRTANQSFLNHRSSWNVHDAQSWTCFERFGFFFHPQTFLLLSLMSVALTVLTTDPPDKVPLRAWGASDACRILQLNSRPVSSHWGVWVSEWVRRDKQALCCVFLSQPLGSGSALIVVKSINCHLLLT